MVRIQAVLGVPAVGGYYCEDLSSLQHRQIDSHGPYKDSERWFLQAPESSGLSYVRELAEVVSLGLNTGDTVGWGDCVGVSYGGKSGRKTPLRSAAVEQILASVLTPWLLQYELRSLREFCHDLDDYTASRHLDLHPGITYGLSQAVLATLAPRGDMFRVIGAEWDLNTFDLKPLPLQGSSGNSPYENADKMLYRKLAALPHGQVDHPESQVGSRGEVLLAYGRWLKERMIQFSAEDYRPVIHLDVHGGLGIVGQGDIPAVGDFIMELETVIAPYPLRMESPLLAESLDQQIETYLRLKDYLKTHRSQVVLVADEWANSKADISRMAAAQCVHMIHLKTPNIGSLASIVDSAIECRSHGVQVLLGGSCVETEISTRATVHVGMVVRPEVLLVKPGMGIDEGYMLCHNEMARIGALSKSS